MEHDYKVGDMVRVEAFHFNNGVRRVTRSFTGMIEHINPESKYSFWVREFPVRADEITYISGDER